MTNTSDPCHHICQRQHPRPIDIRTCIVVPSEHSCTYRSSSSQDTERIRQCPWPRSPFVHVLTFPVKVLVHTNPPDRYPQSGQYTYFIEDPGSDLYTCTRRHSLSILDRVPPPLTTVTNLTDTPVCHDVFNPDHYPYVHRHPLSKHMGMSSPLTLVFICRSGKRLCLRHWNDLRPRFRVNRRGRPRRGLSHLPLRTESVSSVSLTSREGPFLTHQVSPTRPTTKGMVTFKNQRRHRVEKHQVLPLGTPKESSLSTSPTCIRYSLKLRESPFTTTLRGISSGDLYQPLDDTPTLTIRNGK